MLLAVGLGCLGWVGYQYIGTNVVAERRFDTERQELRNRWTAAAPTPSPPPGSSSAAPTAGRPPTAAPVPLPKGATALLRVPKFGAGYEVPVVEGTGLSQLARGVGHYTGTAVPGAVGNFSLAGHRVTHGKPFSRLLELDVGDQVVVETSTAIYTYVLDTAPQDLTVDDTASWVLDPVPGQPETAPSRSLITLTTCQDLFHSPDRSVGFGHLASTQNK